MMTVSLPQGLQEFVDESVRSGRYGSEEELFYAAVRLLQEREQERREKLATLETELLKGVEALERNGSRPFDDAALERIKAEGRRQLAAAEEAA